MGSWSRLPLLSNLYPWGTINDEVMHQVLLGHVHNAGTSQYSHGKYEILATILETTEISLDPREFAGPMSGGGVEKHVNFSRRKRIIFRGGQRSVISGAASLRVKSVSQVPLQWQARAS